MNLYQEAENLIKESRVEEILGDFGTVLLEGSYAYKTMVDRDIDYKVTLDGGKELLTYELRAEILSNLSKIKQLRGIQMADIYHFPEGASHAIEGIWFGLGLISNDTHKRWNIDVWFVGQDSRDEADKQLVERLVCLSDDERTTIVEIKQAALDADVKEKGVTSVEIYRAVLERNIKTYKEFLAEKTQESDLWSIENSPR